MASCLSCGGGRPYPLQLDCLDIVKSVSTSPARSSHSPCSTILDSSNSDSSSCNSSSYISFKKPRAPRKRPNQTYNEAAALLSSLYPSIFNPIQKKPNKRAQVLTLHVPPDNPNSVLLPPFPHFLLRDRQPLLMASEFVPPSPSSYSFRDRYPYRDQAGSPVSSPSPSPLTISSEVEVTGDDDFDAESILDEECSGEGIDSIMGKLSVDGTTTGTEMNPTSIKSLIGINGLCSKLEHFNRAFKNRGRAGTDWYQSQGVVPMKEIFTKFKPEKKKSNKKKKSGEVPVPVPVDDVNQLAASGTAAAPKVVKLGLKLNHDDVISAWSDRGSLFSEGPDSPPSAETLANIDLSLEGRAGCIREASVMRYKEKRRTRLFSKKIRYQVRKVNADQRPRMKGRFVRSPSLLQQALEEEQLGARII